MISIKAKTNLTIQSTRCFSVWFPLNQKSHYETLGIQRGASQADIKSAFYRLSKKHHPDANVNDPTATARFQEISEAYEVLGNDDSRRRYDVGMSPSTATVSRAGFKTADDPKAAFYKSRLTNRMNQPTADRMYNFDEWTKNHYSESLKSNRTMHAQTGTRNMNEPRRVQKQKGSVFEGKIAVVFISVIIVALLTLQSTNPDSPKNSR